MISRESVARDRTSGSDQERQLEDEDAGDGEYEGIKLPSVIATKNLSQLSP